MNMQNSYLTSKPHYEILDGLRGVAAAMVVAFHLLEAHSGGNHLNQIINHGYLAVDFFLYNPDITSFFLLLNHFFISEKE